jgi:hypothetical protein
LAIRSFSFQNVDTNVFAQNFSNALKGRELGKIVSLSASQDVITITLAKLGTSELRYSVVKQTDGTRVATLTQEKIALTHRAFRSDIEQKLMRILEKCGATPVTAD